MEVLKWQDESDTTDEPQTSEHVLENFRGNFKIDFDEIELKEKIGSGGFSDVHFAKWKGTIVAAKVLRVQRVSKRRLREFTDEIFVLCKLDHPNIVNFIGASVVTPNLCILIEYMQMSLFDALHMREDVEFSEKEKITIIQHTAQGLQYLHDNNIAHCDMKSQNILLNYKPDDEILVLVVKITDFGLSMMKNNTDTSSSAGGEYVRNIGTPRYSSPENLRGELLNVKSFMMSDIYSYSLVVFEVIYEDEPFSGLTYQQIKKKVGELSLLPNIPENFSISPSVLLLMKKCWDRVARKRPTAKQFVDQALRIDHLYEQN